MPPDNPSIWRRDPNQTASGKPGTLQTAPIPHTPHWIDKIDGELVLNAKRVALLNEVYDLYLDGVGIHRIVTLLNDRGEPRWTPEKSQRVKNGWFYSYIYRLLTKRTVLGEYVTMSGEIVSSDFYPQAISTDKFNQVQAALALRKGNQRKDKRFTNRNLLQGIIVCDQCGGGAHFRHTTDTPQTYKDKKGVTRTYVRKTYRRVLCDRARRQHECDNKIVLNYDVLEATVLDQLLPQLVKRPDEDAEQRALRESLAELIRLRDADQARLEALVDALADGGSKTIVGRITALEEVVDAQTSAIEAARKALSMAQSKPPHYDDVMLIDSLRAELTSSDDEIRTYARGRVNMSLRRLIRRIAITPVGTFRIEPDAQSWWLFDDEGRMLEGAYAP